mgnify:CR=1 FL=1
MKIIIIFIDLLMATVLFFIKSRNTEISVLFLSGDYTGLNTEKICRVTGKRIKTWAMLFCLGGIIDFIKRGAGIIIVSVFLLSYLYFI